MCRFTEHQRNAVHKMNYNYFGSIMVEGAPPERLRTVCDWGNWVCWSERCWHYGS